MSAWPAYMLKRTVCRYLEIGEAALEAEVARGTIPPPIRLGNRDHWSKDAIDRALGEASGVPDYRLRLQQGRKVA